MDTQAIFEGDCSSMGMLGKLLVVRGIWQKKTGEKGNVNLSIMDRQERI